VDSLWPERPPATARDQVVNVVSALRRLLGAAGRPATRQWLATQPPGYRARIGPGQLDAEKFEALVRTADAQSAAGHPERAAPHLRTALELWRGPALADVPARFAVNEARRLEELRLAALEKLMEAEFALGRHRDLVPELTRLVAEHPLRERLRGQLMVALHAIGRTGDALAVYRAGHRLMVDELGLDPGAELRRLERAILAGAGRAPAVAGPPGARPAPPERVVVAFPAQLPRDVADFTGRRDEVAAICRLLVAEPAGGSGADGPPAAIAVPVVVVTGPPGVGKSALATHVAHLMRARFPDGQVHFDLRGIRGHENPAGVLTRVLLALGVPRAEVPADLPGRVQLYRSITAPRRVLVVLDDTVDAAQARPLLPGGAGCAVLITSRAELAGLEGAHRVRLDTLPVDDALSLLAAAAGAHRVAAEPVPARRIVDLCGRLPLALRVAGGRAAVQPELSLRRLADRLADPDRRLNELRVGGLDVRASLAASLRGLTPEEALAARRLALLDVTSFPLWTVTALLRVDPAEAEDLVDRLVERHIIECAGPDALDQPRYRLAELARVFLRERAQPLDAAEIARIV
jgi:DNA-binding SARP family transcriptional activator